MRSRLAALVLVASALATTGAHAAGPDADKADPVKLARTLFDSGRALYNAGKLVEAIDAFEHAERLHHAPTIVFSLALANAASGKLVEARALLVRVRDERLSATAPQVFKDVQRDAASQIEALDKRIPTVKVLVRGGGGKSLTVSLDDVERKDYRPDKALSMNVGAHRITVVPGGGVGVTRTVEAKEGARLLVEFELAGAAPMIVKVPAIARPAEGPAPWRLPAYLCFGVGAAGLALGVGGTVYAGVKSAELNDACRSGRCPTSEHDSEISLGRAMNVSGNVGFVVGGAGIVAGTVLLLVSRRPKEPSRASLLVGPGSVGVEGVF